MPALERIATMCGKSAIPRGCSLVSGPTVSSEPMLPLFVVAHAVRPPGGGPLTRKGPPPAGLPTAGPRSVRRRRLDRTECSFGELLRLIPRRLEGTERLAVLDVDQDPADADADVPDA